jgi:regulation of enolase protein 1 (concanavalin A-like superfamily)
VQPAKEAVGDLSRQMADLLGQMAEGLAEAPDPKRAAEWLDQTRALRGEIERVDDALAQAEESVRLNPRRLRLGDPAVGLRDGVDTLERAATDMRVLARSVADSARIDSEHTPVKEAETRSRLAAVIAELSAAVRAYGQLLEADPVAPAFTSYAAEPITEALEDHLEEAQRQTDQLAGLLSTDPAERPEGWQLRGEILAHVDRLRSELEPSQLPEPAQVKPLLAPSLQALRDRHRSERHQLERHQLERHEDGRLSESATGPRRRPNRSALRVRARRTASRGRTRRAGLAVVDGLDVVAVRVAQEHPVVARVVLRPLARGMQHQIVRRGCLVHVVLTAWLRHPRRKRGAGRGAAGRTGADGAGGCGEPWETTRVTALKLPGLPFALEPEGSPPPGCRIRSGVLTLTAAANTDLFVDPAGAEQLPDAGRFTGLPPAGDFTLAAQVSVEFASMYDAGVLLLHAAEREWAKLCFEYSPQLRPTAVTVVTRGTSDDCNSFEVDGNTLWLRITRSGAAWAFHASADGAWWRLLRYFTLGRDLVRVGFLAQSPAGQGCAATFDHITFRAGAPENLRDGS